MATLTTIGFDADDTLWQNERFFQMTQDAVRRAAGRSMPIPIT
jgi:FMN phosphatase YigB (HAD superfamily)